MSEIENMINNAVMAARENGLFERSSDPVDKEADIDAGDSGPDSIVEEHLKEEAAKEASGEMMRQVKVGLNALLTAGDSCLAVERYRRGREGS